LFKAWQLNIYKKNSSISSKPDRAHICIINPVSKKLCINEAGVGTNNDYSLRSFVNSAYGNNDVSSTFMNNNGDVELSTPVMRTQTFLMSKVLVVGRITDGAQNNTGQCDLIFEGLFYYFASLQASFESAVTVEHLALGYIAFLHIGSVCIETSYNCDVVLKLFWPDVV
ncbi:hypothetical protein Tco_1431754, partial [Tanacetum coccineum]